MPADALQPVGADGNGIGLPVTVLADVLRLDLGDPGVGSDAPGQIDGLDAGLGPGAPIAGCY